ncbi:hypothetical protein P7C73_g799, partial [Tremellales sp. Uapishka_1]
MPSYRSIAVTNRLSCEAQNKLAKHFDEVFYHPDGVIPDHELRVAEVFFSNWTGFPANVTSLDQIPNAKVLQLSSGLLLVEQLEGLGLNQGTLAGAGKAISSPIFRSDEGRKQISVSSASEYREVERWSGIQIDPLGSSAPAVDLGKNGRSTRRETARLLKAFNVEVIAANSSGTRREDDGYIIPGTGDKDGSIPSKYYSTNDTDSFTEFLSRCDILIASLPSTPQTTYMLTAEHLSRSPPSPRASSDLAIERLPKDAIFINVGRGDLAYSEDILAALDQNLLGVALDVTDPEPLPDKHPLFTHPKAIITPHTSGSFKGYFDAGADLCIINIEGARKGNKLLNVIDIEKGY